MRLTTLTLLILCSTVFAIRLEKQGTVVDVLGQSGKIRLIRGGKTITVEFDNLQEVDANGAPVGMSGALSTKHGVNSFATQNFQFSSIQTNITYRNVSMDRFDFTSPINSIGKLKITTFIINEVGSVSTLAEKWNVQPGDMKWNIEMNTWQWCTACSEGTGAYIDLDIVVKTIDAEPTEQGNKTFSIGDASLQLSDEVRVDDVAKYMPSGWPKFATKGNKKVFSFRFPKFANKVVYDPLFQYGTSSAPSMFSSGIVCTVIMLIIQTLI